MEQYDPCAQEAFTQVGFDDQAISGIGMVVPFDFELDAECWRWVPRGASLYISRMPVPYGDHSIGDHLLEQVADIDVICETARPLSVLEIPAVAYSCTSGSFRRGLAGEAAICQALRDVGVPEPRTTSGALLEALRAMGARRLAIVSPYTRDLTSHLLRFLGEAGYEVESCRYMGLTSGIARVSLDTVRRLLVTMKGTRADVVFASCTNLRTFEVIVEAEVELHRPVLSANQVTIWSCLRAADLPLPAIDQALFSVDR